MDGQKKNPYADHAQTFDSAKTPEAGETAGQDVNLTDEELLALCKERFNMGPPAEGEESTDELRKQLEDDRLRQLAEMDNFRKRMQREQEEFRKYAKESVLADLLPILDNLELALTHGRKVEACKDVVLGVEMTQKLFMDVLASHNLTPVGACGEPFNPEHHEAVGQEAAEGVAPGCVANLVQRGYRLGERLLRPAKVLVAPNCGPGEEAE